MLYDVEYKRVLSPRRGRGELSSSHFGTASPSTEYKENERE